MPPLFESYSKKFISSKRFPSTTTQRQIDFSPNLYAWGMKPQYTSDFQRQQFGVENSLLEINKAINESKYILDLHDNWDDDGSIGYEKSTWDRSVGFLTVLGRKAFEVFNVKIDAPKIYQGPDGSIDMLWKKENYKLLVNFPSDVELPISFYGNTGANETLKGSFDINNNSNLLLFLIGAKQCIPQK